MVPQQQQADGFEEDPFSSNSGSRRACHKCNQTAAVLGAHKTYTAWSARVNTALALASSNKATHATATVVTKATLTSPAGAKVSYHCMLLVAPITFFLKSGIL